MGRFYLIDKENRKGGGKGDRLLLKTNLPATADNMAEKTTCKPYGLHF